MCGLVDVLYTHFKTQKGYVKVVTIRFDIRKNCLWMLCVDVSEAFCTHVLNPAKLFEDCSRSRQGFNIRKAYVRLVDVCVSVLTSGKVL